MAQPGMLGNTTLASQYGAVVQQPQFAVDPAFAHVVESVRARIELEELKELHRRQMSRARVRYELVQLLKK
eukprot:1194531-Pleurochrysis_carterae.AAC.2